MTAVRALVALPFGLAFGSFLTVVIHRVPAGESLVAPRSRCPVCGTRLRARDNIPVVSWLLLGGRCHACGTRISAQYPLTELATAALFVGAALRFERILAAAMMGPFLGLMLAVALIDARTRIIPNRLVYPALIGFPLVIVAGWLVGGGVSLPRASLGFLAYGGSLFVVALISPRGMGMGDVKLAALIGLVLGSLGVRYAIIAALSGILLGGLGAMVALAMGAGRKQAIPFGPFLAAGALVAAFVGPEIARFYLHLPG